MCSKLLFLLVSAILVVTYVAARTEQERLVSDLLKDYVRAVDPGNTPLRMGVSYVCASLDSETHQMKSKLLEKYSWDDSRLKWTPSDYSDIEQIRLPAKLLWTPDVKLYNSYDEPEIRDEVNALVNSNGTVIWIPMVVYKTHCSAHNEEDGSTLCKLQIGSWTYDATNLDLQLDGPGFDTYMYLDTCPYTLSDANVKVERKVYPCCPDPYASLLIDFKIRPRD